MTAKKKKVKSTEEKEASGRPVPFNTDLFPSSIDEGMEGSISIDKASISMQNEAVIPFEVTSNYGTIGNISWKMSITSTQGNKAIFCKITSIEQNTSPHWFITASFQLSAVDSDGKIHMLIPWTIFETKANNLSEQLEFEDSLLTKLISSEDVPDTTAVSLSFKMDLVVIRSFGFRQRQRVTMDLSQRSEQTDCVLEFSTGNLYVNSSYLAQLSDFFTKKKTYNYEVGSSSANSEHTYCSELPVMKMTEDIEEFRELMLVVYPSRKPIDATNVEYILQLADKLSFLGVLVDCETFLMTAEGDRLDVFIRLDWACRYHMGDLQNHCLAKLTSSALIKGVLQSPIYDGLSYEVMKALFERHMKMA